MVTRCTYLIRMPNGDVRGGMLQSVLYVCVCVCVRLSRYLHQFRPYNNIRLIEQLIDRVRLCRKETIHIIESYAALKRAFLFVATASDRAPRSTGVD